MFSRWRARTALSVVQSGDIRIDENLVKATELAVLDRVRIESETSAKMLVLTGEPIGEPVVGQGPFVMNTREEISQAIQDYRSGRMGQLVRFHFTRSGIRSA